jgi:integrase
MLSKAIAQYTASRRALGFKYYTEGLHGANFAAFAERHGDKFTRVDRMLEWARQVPSHKQQYARLRVIRIFARALHADDPRHEVPNLEVLGKCPRIAHIPRIYTPSELGRIIEAAQNIPPADSLNPHMYRMIFGLLAATGMRVSEALALDHDDVTKDGLIVRQTKFKKSRLLPLHPTTRRELMDYLRVRERLGGPGKALFVSIAGKRANRTTVTGAFRRIVRALGLHRDAKKPKPRLHDLRHTFAVRSLEKCPHNSIAVTQHMLALSTYLGHSHVTDTWWYLRTTPVLLRRIARSGETLHNGGVQ